LFVNLVEFIVMFDEHLHKVFLLAMLAIGEFEVKLVEDVLDVTLGHPHELASHDLALSQCFHNF